jgi:DNA helicase HerA-like ATPase
VGGICGGATAVSENYLLAVDKLNEHTLVCGGTKSGKSNTVMHILLNLYRHYRIPFLVIEPVGSEYHELAAKIADLRVYTAGNEQSSEQSSEQSNEQSSEQTPLRSPLRLNPLEPERGTRISTHIEDLTLVFNAAYDLEPALRVALHNLIRYTYDRHGVDIEAVYNPDTTLMPTIKDMLLLLPEFVERELKHSAEIRNNFYGAIEHRLTLMTYGLMGRLVNTSTSIEGAELCEGWVVIDLDELSNETRVFVVNLIMVKINRYLRTKPKSHGIANVIVVEEAHNVFINPKSDGSSQSSKALSSDYFASLLREIRKYGTGIIVVDQRPSQLDPNAIANTSVKIIHAMQEADDIASIKDSARLSEHQRKLVPLLKTGEAIIAQRGVEQVCKVKVCQAKD